MATLVTNTPLPCDSSTPVVSCAARALDGEQRQPLALQALAGHEPITELAKCHQVSRQFVYQQAAQGAQALEQAVASPTKDTEVLFYLPVTKAWRRQVVLGLILLCHRSFRGVIAFFHDLLDCPLSLGTVHNIVQEAVTVAQQVNATQDLAPVRAASHDELFQAGQPVWVGIDLDATYCYRLAPVEPRDAETWGIHLLALAEQGLRPDYPIADGGRGWRAGQALAWPGIPGNGDVFHGRRELTKLNATLERRASAALTQREALERQMAKAKQRRQGRTLAARLARARTREVTAIRLADDVRTLSGWLPHDILTLAGPDAPTRQSLYDFVMDSLQALEALDAHRIRPVHRTLVHQRDALLAFATRLDRELETLAQRFTVPVARLRELLALQTMPTTTPTYWQRTGELHHALQDQFHPLQQALLELQQRRHRASSLVENFNSRRRNYCFLRRQIGPRYLDLLRFFLNHHPFKRRQQPHRVGKTPTELLTGQPHPHWLAMLGFTRFQRASQAA